MAASGKRIPHNSAFLAHYYNSHFDTLTVRNYFGKVKRNVLQLVIRYAYCQHMMYSKLFSSLVHSSLWSEPDHIRLLFITLLAIADRDGIVYGSRSGLMRAAMIDLDAADECDPWTRLMGPDDDSSDIMRNPENEGRRIEEIPGGFRIINYTYYKSIRDAEDRKVQNREAQRRHRDKVSPDKPPSATVSRDKPGTSQSLSYSESVCKKELEEAIQSLPGATKLKFEEWMKVRRGMGKKPKDWHKMFFEQVKWLSQYASLIQIEILSASIRNNWQGLFEPKSNGSKPIAKSTTGVYGKNRLPAPAQLSDEEFARQQKIVREGSAQWKKEHGK